MKIRKIEESIGVTGKVTNSSNSSTKDTYSSDYLNKHILAIDTSVGEHEEEVVLTIPKNLFNGEFRQGTRASLTSTEEIMAKIPLYVEAGTTLTLSGEIPSNANARIYIASTSNDLFDFLEVSDLGKLPITFTTTKSGYARINVKSTNISPSNVSNIQLEKGSSATTYEPYKASEIYANKEKYTDTLNIGVEPNNSGLWVEHSDNLLDKSLLVFNKYLNTSNGAIATSTSGNYYATEEYINISKYVGKTLSLTTSMAVAFYKSDKTFISIQIASASRQVVVPANTVYMRVEIGKDYYSAPMINVGTTLLPYEPYIASPSIKVNNNGVYETIVNGVDKIISGNNWTMIKHANGIMEGYLKKYYNDVSITLDWGSLYRSEVFDLPLFPEKFIEVPEVQYNITAGATVFPLQFSSAGITGTGILGVVVASPISRNGSFTFNCHVIGKWK